MKVLPIKILNGLFTMNENQILNPEILKLLVIKSKRFPRTPTDAEYELIIRSCEHVLLGVNWVVKLDWDSKHKMPCSRKVAKVLEPYGEYLHQEFLLCSAIHGRQYHLNFELHYKNAQEWFYLICSSKINEIIDMVLFPQPPNLKIHNGEVKRSIIRNCLSYPRGVLKGKNLLKELIDENPHLLHFCNLLDAAIDLGSKSDIFRKEYLVPFCTTWRRALNSMESSEWKRQSIENNRFIQVK